MRVPDFCLEATDDLNGLDDRDGPDYWTPEEREEYERWSAQLDAGLPTA